MSMLDAPPTLHPLEPLTAEEVSAASAILKAAKGLEATARFVFVTLHEPPKGAVQAGEAVPREAFVVLYERSERKTYEAVVSLTDEDVVSWRHIEGVQSPITFEEFMACEAAVQADPGWQEAMRKRGIEDFSLAMIDPWAAGYTGEEDAATTRRILRPLTWVRSEPGEHGYARPIEGLVVEFDLNAMAVVAVHDYGVVPLPPKSGNYDSRRMADPNNVPHVPSARTDLKPIEITQPEGPSFTVEGHHVRWQKWQLRIGFTPREGLVLHDIGYEDRGTVRPIIYRASLAEMFVPYGDPAPDAPLQERLRHGRVRRRLARQPARARLRLPGGDPLLRRRRQRPGRRADDDPQRHLHARGGRRNRLEAHRLPHRGRRGAAPAAARRSPPSPPSATTSTGTSGTSTPTARSSTRSSSRA